MDKEFSISDIEEVFDIEDSRKVLLKRARLELMGVWGDFYY